MSESLRPTSDDLSRRRLLRSTAMFGLGSAVLAACGGSGTDDGAVDGGGETAPTDAPIDGDQEIVEAIRAAGFGDEVPDWTVINATFEVLTGPGRRLQFGLLDETRSPTQDKQVELAIVRTGDLEVVQTASNPVFHGEGLGIRGVYAFETEIPEPGIHYLVVAGDGHVGVAALQVIRPETSKVPQTGQPFPVVSTPTVEEPGELAKLCTRDPACSMHDVSFKAASEEARPVVLVIATPEFCQTAVCGPVVDVAEDMKADFPDVQWIHAEVFTDAGNTVAPIVTELQLPSEPWTFLVGSDGVLVDRFDGPLVPALLREAVAELS